MRESGHRRHRPCEADEAPDRVHRDVAEGSIEFCIDNPGGVADLIVCRWIRVQASFGHPHTSDVDTGSRLDEIDSRAAAPNEFGRATPDVRY